MPELPEVETVCRGLRAGLAGRTLVRVEQRRPDLRIPLPDRFAERLAGKRVVGVRRRAKFVLIELDDGAVLIVHLGMSGRLVLGRTDDARPPERHDHVVLETDDGVRLVFNDARRFGLMALADGETLDRHPLLARLGPEPLADDFTGPYLAAALAGRRTPIKTALLDQRLVAGIGNIYACEALYRAALSPRRKAATVTGRRAARLVEAIKAVLQEAIRAGGASLRDYVQASGELGYFQHRFAVYGREGLPCPDGPCDPECGGVRRLSQAGRATFYCRRRQR